jgi:hypothetical protein
LYRGCIIEIVVFIGCLLRWGRRRSLWAAVREGRRCGKTMSGSGVVKRVILNIIVIANWLSGRGRRRRSPGCVN